MNTTNDNDNKIFILLPKHVLKIRFFSHVMSLLNHEMFFRRYKRAESVMLCKTISEKLLLRSIPYWYLQLFFGYSNTHSYVVAHSYIAFVGEMKKSAIYKKAGYNRGHMKNREDGSIQESVTYSTLKTYFIFLNILKHIITFAYRYLHEQFFK